MYRKSTIQLVIAVVMLFALISGCTPAAAPAATTAPAAAEPAATTAPAAADPAAAAPTAAPADASAPAGEPKVGGKVVTISRQDFATLDAAKTNSTGGVLELIGASLVAKHPQTGDYVPYLAKSWTVSEDGLTWDFTLREDIKFHDGTPLTAEDFAWTFNRDINPETASPFAGGMLGPVKEITAPEKYVLRIVLTEPFFPLLDGLADSGFLQPLPRAAVEKDPDGFGRHPVGVGPFMLTEWKTGEKIVLERNPDFVWGPEYTHGGPAYIQTIEIRIIPEYTTVMSALKAGDVQYTSNVLAKDLQSLKDTNEFEIKESLKQGYSPYMTFNLEKDPFKDINIRQAMNYAVNREALIKVVMNGEAIPAYGPITPSMTGYWKGVEEIGYKYDVEKAKSLLEASGYKMNADGIMEKDGKPLAVELKVYNNDVHVKLAQVLKDQYKTAGIDVTIVQIDEATLDDQAYSQGDYQAALLGYGYGDADIMYFLFHSSAIGSSNPPRINDPALDEMLMQTRRTIDQTKRNEACATVQKEVVEKAYLAYFYVPKDFLAINKNIQGTIVDKAGNLLMFDAYLVNQ